MPKKIVFATTWWAKKWLEALSNVDYSNRLPRGRSYYTTGRVSSVTFDAATNRVNAIIQGSAYAPYEASIGFSKLPEKDVKRLVAEIGRRPDLCARLLNNILDPEVADICEELGIALFPQSWKDFDMQCSCPDWAVPCKHLAAVYYAIVRTIDADPMWVFAIRGIDLPAELKKAGLDLEESKRLADPDLLDIAQGYAVSSKRQEKSSLWNLPYYQLSSISASLLHLLPQDNAAFKKGMERLYRQLSTAAASLLALPDDAQPLEKLSQQLRVEELKPVLLVQRYASFWKDNQSAQHFLNQRGSSLLLSAILQCPSAQCPNQNVRLLKGFFTLALQLAAHGAVVAQLSKASEGLLVRWLPALQDERVDQLVASASEENCEILMDPDTDIQTNAMGRCLLLLEHCLSFLVKTYTQPTNADLTNPALAALFCRQSLPPGQERSLRQYIEPLSLASRKLSWTPVVILRNTRNDTPAVSLNIGALKKEKQDKRPTLYRDILTQADWLQEKLAAASVFSSLSAACPPVENVLRTSGKPTSIALRDLAPILFEAVPALQLLGAKIMLPKNLSRILRPQLRGSLAGSSSGTGMLTAANLSHFSWQAAIGNTKLTEEEFTALLAKKGQIIPWKDEFVYLDPQALANIQKQLQERKEPGYLEKLQAAFSGELHGIPVEISSGLQARIQSLTQQEDIPVPQGLHAQLRPYQERGFSWLMKNTRLGLGSLIADDMGLGKTLQVIALLQALKNEGDLAQEKILAIVPTTLLVNWQRELARFAPSLSVHVYHGNMRSLEPINTRSDITLTSYGTFRRDAKKLATRSWRLLVIDEAQAAKNAASALSQTLRHFPIRQVVAMSGTPVENNLMEYWAILSAVQPGLLGSSDDFRKTFALPIQTDHDPKALEAFRRLTAPFMLRRLKTDKSIIADLPDKIQQDTFVSLTTEQSVLYQQTLNKLMEKIRDAQTDGEKTKRTALVLQLINSLKQICNSPCQFLKTQSALPDSGKAQLLLDLLDQARKNGKKVLVFTQYREMGERLQQWIGEQIGQRPDFLHGGVTIKKRSEMVDRFQNDPTVPVLLISLKAGGTGLNLTAASVVIHYDLWWNPAVENQATDRAYRIGQKQNVQVYRLICAGTFEEKINQILQQKKTLSDLAVTSGESWIGEMSNQELQALFGLGTSGSC